MAQVPTLAAVPVPAAVHANPDEVTATEAVPVTGTLCQQVALQVPDTPVDVTAVAAHRKSVQVFWTVEAATEAQDPPNAPTVVVEEDDSGVVGSLNDSRQLPTETWAIITDDSSSARNMTKISFGGIGTAVWVLQVSGLL